MRSRMSSISKEKRYRGAIVLEALDCGHFSPSPMIHPKPHSSDLYSVCVDHFDPLYVKALLNARGMVLYGCGLSMNGKNGSVQPIV